MANLKQIKAKIKSVGNLKKITRALEVVSTVKLQKIKNQAEGLKLYLMQVMRILWTVSPKIDIFEQEKASASAERTAVMVITSERGLCGGLNTKLLRKVVQEHDLQNTDFFVVGKKGLEFLKRLNVSIVGHMQVGETFSSEELLALYTFFEDAIRKWAYKKVSLYFNFFKNSIIQIPTSIQVFPLSLVEVKMFFDGIEFPLVEEAHADSDKDILVEPSLDEVRTEIRRQIRNYVILSALVQNKTGEHAARMIAMKNAKDNATGFVKALTLKFNKERQAAITKEISEIVSAKIAIEG
jgi:F-type H+-transporting ATPase subunit gamma